MWKKSLLKAALVIALALAMVMPVSAASTKTQNPTTITPMPKTMGRSIIFNDSFETYADFLIDFPPWTNIDVDGADTFGHSAYTWPNQWLPQAFIVFNPYTTTPPMSGEPAALPHTGQKYAAAFNDNNPTYTSDDWLITPQLSGTYNNVSFWAKSYSTQYNLERIQVGVSTTTPTPEAMTIISTAPYITVPQPAWTPYSFDISGYSGNIYIGIHFCSVDSWFLMLDDFAVTGGAGDTTPPVTTIDLNGTLVGSVYTSDVKVTLTATDDSSGVNYTMVKVDTGTFTKYLGTFTVSADGSHTISYYSVDIAGNVETTQTATFTIQHPISIVIKGGIGVTATITNNANTSADIHWTIGLNGGVIIIGKNKAGNATIGAGLSYKAKDFVIGFGKTTITATAGGVTKTATAKVLLFFVLGVA